MNLVRNPKNKHFNKDIKLHKKQRKISNGVKGFTLVETIVVIFVFTLIMGAVSGLIVMAYRTKSYTWYQSTAIDEARRGIETMIKEIREAKSGDNGFYPVESAGDKEFIFYSDIDNDGKTERVRYFLATVNSETLIQECQTSVTGGICSVNFSNFLKGTPISTQVKVSVEGDFNWNNREYAEIFADSQKLGEVCRTGCSDCPGAWQGTTIFALSTSTIADNSIIFSADATSYVSRGGSCPSYSMKAIFEFSFVEDLSAFAHEFKKGVIKPIGDPPTYPSSQEQISVLTSYVRNVPPIFEYFDQAGNKIEDYPARSVDTKMMKVYLAVNVNPNQPPQDFELESYVQLRNLKEE